MAFFRDAATTGVSGLDRKVDKVQGDREVARGKILGASGQDLDRHGGRGGMAGGEKSGLEEGLSLAEGSRVEQGRAFYLDRVLSAKCFC